MTTHTGPGTAETWTDELLVARMLARQPLAWSEFQRRFDRLVYRCILRVTSRFQSVTSGDDVKEIYCNLMVSLAARDMHKLRTFEPERGNKLSSWIGMLATNAAYDYLRTVSRRPSCAPLAEARELSENTQDPCEQTIARQRCALVEAALADFSSKDREFVQCYFVEGLSPEQVAERMGISVKTVYTKKHKIRCRLESALAHASDEAAAA